VSHDGLSHKKVARGIFLIGQRFAHRMASFVWDGIAFGEV
jgi:hypothetical protein